MLASSPTPIPHSACEFAGKSFIPPTGSLRFRRPGPVAISSAHAAATMERRTAATSSFNSSCLKVATTSFYEVLGIPFGATSDEIKSAFRRLARVCHPDVASGDRKSSSADEFMKLHAAYSTLSDPDKRAAYDRRLFSRRQSIGLCSAASPALSMFSGYTYRNWETDQCW